jgi:ArsR family transcriptional regulator, virulence genes transcriptional regulator
MCPSDAINEDELIVKSNAESSAVIIPFKVLNRAAHVLKALNHPIRQNIIKILDEEDKLTVTDLYIKMRMEQSVASQQLAILRRAGIVKTEREGKYVYYMINKARLEEISEFIENITKGN